ncbi:MAG TPA: PAS domain-containing protein [Stellaceae bacterium]|jgi:hypothetical protein
MPAEVLGHATLGALFRYWDRQRNERAMPARRDIDPIEMGPKLLPHLMLCELADRGHRIRFRLVGTFLVKRLGYDPTGQWLADLPRSDYLDFLAKMLRQTYTESAPFFAASSFRWGVKGRLDAQHLMLPLTTGGGEPSMVLIGIAYASHEVFPPQIRVLDSLARHSGGARELVDFAPPDWPESKSVKIA